jgi:hypothetical protein
MTDKPVNLDEHRGMAAQKDTEIRRDLREVQVDQAALRARQEKLETLLLAAPAATWLEAAAKARYLIELFAATPNAQDPRRRKIIASALEELTRLSDQKRGSAFDLKDRGMRREVAERPLRGRGSEPTISIIR